MDEQDDKKALNTPGGTELLKRFGSIGGLPFFAFLDSRGALIVSSIRPKERGGGNIGHPFESFEIDWFMGMLAKAAPGMKAEEAATLEKWLRAQKK